MSMQSGSQETNDVSLLAINMESSEVDVLDENCKYVKTGLFKRESIEGQWSELASEDVDVTHSDDMKSTQSISGSSTMPFGEPVDLSVYSVNSRNTNSRVKLIACEICNKLFSRAFNLQRHVAVTHAGQRSYVCEICGKACAHAYTLKQHMLIHTKSKVFSCDMCNKHYTDPSTLRRHKFRKHARETQTTDTGNSSPSRKRGNHIASGTAPYICDQCGKELNSLDSLTSHKRIHTGTRRCNCFICFKTYSSPQSLASHMLTHSGIRPYRCKTCEKCFTHPSHLKRHQLLHTGEKPYVCETCGRSFNQSSSLRQHVLIHTGEKPHGCEICGKSFRQFSTLQRHKLMHSNQSSVKTDEETISL